MKFSHLHVHTQYSLLDGAADISALYKKAASDGMPAIAITDHGNMFGAFNFVAEAAKHPGIKPIVGCEFYLTENRHKKQFTRDEKDSRYHQLFLAKNAEGYKNLVKLCSLGYMEGTYGKYPRIDKELVEKYHGNLVATTCCLGAIVPRTILRKGEAEAEKEFKWWLSLFGEDYYVELQRHDIPEQNEVNEVLLKWAIKYNVKTIASNDSHYVNVEDYNAHDILLCINTAEKQSTPSIKEFADDDVQVKGKRFAFYNDQFYFKTTEEMSQLFSDVPEAIDNTNEIVDKVEHLSLKKDILLPHFPIPPDFASQDDYLKHLAYEGAKKRYKEITPEIEERLNFELFTAKTMGFAGYFLIVADFIKAGREMGVLIGPGRGSAAGSVVAYCLGITNIDPFKYNLLFERFLNPDRKSMPDIDTDFDDAGRQKVIDYVVKKYSYNQVAHIITYGSMAAKMSIKDVARVLDLPLPESNTLTKLVPERPGIELKRVLKAPIDGENNLKSREGLNNSDLENVKKLREIYKSDDLAGRVLREAEVLEGSVRNTGIHAAGIIIAPKDLTEIIPVCTSKESPLLVSQFDGVVIEDAGVIKMDFLGLKTLTIIRDALLLIEQNHGIRIDIDSIPFDDKKTFLLYQRGETNGTFQFESAGMQKHLRSLKPDKIEDLIAMNALYRPGPMEYIDSYIARKHDPKKITYDLPEMEEILKETYGITVYQEQVMLLSQKLAGFSKGDADTLRKAMGKKLISVLNKMEDKFMAGATANGYPKEKLQKIWNDWKSFASYAFNKSHSTCYAYVAFQTAYLKANYPAEYMSAVLTHNLSNIDKITFFMDECRRMGLKVLGPDVNESQYNFAVNKNGQIRFGLGAVKGVGEAAVNALIEERQTNGPFKDIFDLAKRVSNKAANKKCFESLAQAGAFDCFTGTHRAQYFASDSKEGMSGIERAIRFGNALANQKSSLQNSLFGEDHHEVTVPHLAKCQPWNNLEQLHKEKDVIGFYISGHPLDDFKMEIRQYCTHSIDQLNELESLKGKDISFAGIIIEATQKISKKGKPYGTVIVEDYSGSVNMLLFSEEYGRFKEFLVPNTLVHVRASIMERISDTGQAFYNLKPFAIKYLSDISDTFTKSITIKVPIQVISDKFVQHIKKLAAESPGKAALKFVINDSNENLSLDIPSRNYRVRVSNSFIEKLHTFENIEYHLN